jgi:hypothetical protein
MYHFMIGSKKYTEKDRQKNSLLDAFPVVCIQIIDNMKVDIVSWGSMWTCKENKMELLDHVPMEDIPKILLAILQKNPVFIVGVDSAVNEYALRERDTRGDCIEEF